MNWFHELFAGQSTAHTVMILSLVIVSGVALGHIRVWGVSLGIAGVLFSGLVFGHFNLTAGAEVIEFAREFGLILFVYTIGMQVGPSFFASFRTQGLKLNLLAAAIVFLGVATALTLHAACGLPLPVTVGLLSGAVTNTPGLGAAQEALKETAHGALDAAQLSGVGYAVAYPFGVIGVILTMIIIRRIFRVNPQQEADALERAHSAAGEAPVNYNIEVTNPRLVGQPVQLLSSIVQADFVVSRLLRDSRVEIPSAETRLQLGDVLHIVCSKIIAEKLAVLVGDISTVDVRSVASQVTARGIFITQREAVGRTVRALALMERYGAAITRVNRAGIELVAGGNTELHFGDRVTVVGEETAIRKVATELGDSIRQLNHPNILPVFIGVILGVLAGSIPFSFPGMPAPVKLGLAGGPLLVAILLSRFGRIGPVVWYLPQSANLVLREIGITLFLACVGLKSGVRIWETLVQGDGLYWLLLGALITLLPLLIVGVFARAVCKLNYLSLCGLLAGSMTDPPALSFANQMSGSDAPAITYASVYALVMFLRILSAQAIVLFLG